MITLQVLGGLVVKAVKQMHDITKTSVGSMVANRSITHTLHQRYHLVIGARVLATMTSQRASGMDNTHLTSEMHGTLRTARTCTKTTTMTGADIGQVRTLRYLSLRL
jgi:hypothetical protein